MWLFRGLGARAAGWWDRLVEPLVALGPVERRKARLLAGLLLSLVVLGAISAAVQAATISTFQRTLIAILGALLVLAISYAGSRTQFYRFSAGLAVAAPALACIAVGVLTPDDHVWYCFILIAVVFSSLFFSVRTAATVAVAIFVALCLMPIWVLELRAPGRLLPVLALHGVLSPLILIAAHHHATVEREAHHELLRRDAQLAEIERLEDFARSAAHVSHDLNNLLTIIDANVIHLDRDFVQGRAEVVGEIRAAIVRLSALSRTLMTTARERLQQTTEFEPSDVIRELAPLLSKMVGPSVEILVSEMLAVGKVAMDPLRLEQVLMNLVANARDAMPNGGRISIECSTVIPPGRRNGDTGYVAIDVIDTGVGMSDDLLGRIFTPFFTTKTNGRGTGLGLAIVQEVIEYYGGEVRVTSTPGQGSRFRVLLPTR